MTPEQPILLHASPPSRAQKRLAVIVALLLLAGYFIAVPFTHTHVARVDAFVPIIDTVLLFVDVMTAILLYAQFSIFGSRALLALASAYLFTGLMIIPHTLTFPFVFSATGLLGADVQTSVYVYVFWHLGLPGGAIIYGLLKSAEHEGLIGPGVALRGILVSSVLVVLLVVALTWLSLHADTLLPPIMTDAGHANREWTHIAPVLLLLDVVAFAAVWRRRGSILDLWLMLVLWAWFVETIFLTTTADRFTVVWYAGKTYALLAGSFVLAALLSQTTRLYAKLAVTALTQRREREGRHLSVDAAMSLVSHEIRQPLSAIMLNGAVARAELAKAGAQSPELDAVIQDIVGDSRRLSDVIGNLRATLIGRDRERVAVDLGHLIEEVLGLVRAELKHRGIAVEVNFNPRPPPVLASKI